jgi:hypothetical protein
MRYREFHDFIDRGGGNPIREWLHSLEVAARIEFQEALRTLEEVQQPSRNELKPLTEGKCKGLWEVRLRWKKVQYRPIGFQGPGKRELTLLFVATIRDNKLNPPNTCDTANRRRALVEADPIRRKCEHRYD